VGQDRGRVLPIYAGSSFVQSVPEAHTLGPWTGFLVLVLWVALALTIGAVLLQRRDA
jgi:hypothetical protein